MTTCVFNIPPREEIDFTVDDGFIVISQSDQLGNDSNTLRIHYLDADWMIAGIKAAAEAAKQTSE